MVETISKKHSNHHDASAALVLVAKAPQPGKVKTRLLGKLETRQAAAVHAAFLSYWRRLGKRWTRSEKILLYAPPASAACWYNWADWRIMPQAGGHLGRRLAAAAKRLFAGDFRRLVFVGADAPDMTIPQLHWALDHLDSHHAVMIPAHDGGYTLIGLTPASRPLLENIDWGTDRVAGQTRRRAAAAGIALAERAPMPDVDTPADLRGLLRRLAKKRDAAGRRLHRDLCDILGKHPL